MHKQKGTGSIVVISALRAESQTLQQHANTLDLRISGMGGVAVNKHLNELSLKNTSGLISWGVCGALQPHLEPGDLLIPKTVTNVDKHRFECDAKWRKSIQNCLPDAAHNTGLLNCLITDSHTVAATPRAKIALAETSNAQAVDMESYAVAKFANKHNIPFIIVRAVVDTADDALPSASAFNPGQSSVSFNTLFKAITRPTQWPALMRTGRQFNAALTSLKLLADNSINALCMPSNKASSKHD